MKMCKRHNKPKNQVWDERQAGGGMLNRIGCIDCKELAQNAPPRPRPRPPNVTPIWRRPWT